MKKKCIDPKIGDMIAKYEFGLLSDEEKKIFETHVTQCDACFRELYENAPAMKIISESREEFLNALRTNEPGYIQKLMDFLKFEFFPKPIRIAVPVVATIILGFFIITTFYKSDKQNEDIFTTKSDSVTQVTPYQPETQPPKASIEKLNPHINLISTPSSHISNTLNMKISQDKNSILVNWQSFDKNGTYQITIKENKKEQFLLTKSGIKDTTYTIPLNQLTQNIVYRLEISSLPNSTKIVQLFEFEYLDK